jgi:ATP-dependent DNA helicase RecQ
MKSEQDITVNRARRRAPAGGVLGRIDSVGQGRGQVLPAGAYDLTQAAAAVGELERLSRLSGDTTNWPSGDMRNWPAS